MPSTISDLFDDISLKPTCFDVVPWGTPVPSNQHGIYMVSLSGDFNRNTCYYDTPPIDRKAVAKWLRDVPGTQFNKQSASVDSIVMHLGEFWLPDESTLYIGQTSGKTTVLRTRVNQYYRHSLGKSSPHRGGHWIKTLSVLNDTFVHYAETSNPKLAEFQLIEAFSARVSSVTRKQLADPDHPLPFANLSNSIRKSHRITKSTV